MGTSQYTNGIYLEKVKDWHVGDSIWKASKVMQMIRLHQLSPASVCDVGCGAGVILAELQKKMGAGVMFTGYDVSPQAIQIAKTIESPNLKFFNEDFLKADTPSANLTLMLDVFEHVPDYIGFLEAFRRKTDWVIFHIPLDINARAVLRKSSWMLHMRETYGHLHYFTRETALATLADIGYKIVDSTYTDDMEISDAMIPKKLKSRMFYELRKLLYRVNKRLAVASFEHFNLLVLARGDLSDGASAT